MIADIIKLPDLLLLDFLEQWFLLSDLCCLDTSCCSKQYRISVLGALRIHKVKAQSNVVSDSFMSWVHLRKIKLQSLTLVVPKKLQFIGMGIESQLVTSEIKSLVFTKIGNKHNFLGFDEFERIDPRIKDKRDKKIFTFHIFDFFLRYLLCFPKLTQLTISDCCYFEGGEHGGNLVWPSETNLHQLRDLSISLINDDATVFTRHAKQFFTFLSQKCINLHRLGLKLVEEDSCISFIVSNMNLEHLIVDCYSISGEFIENLLRSLINVNNKHLQRVEFLNSNCGDFVLLNEFVSKYRSTLVAVTYNSFKYEQTYTPLQSVDRVSDHVKLDGLLRHSLDLELDSDCTAFHEMRGFAECFENISQISLLVDFEIEDQAQPFVAEMFARFAHSLTELLIVDGTCFMNTASRMKALLTMCSHIHTVRISGPGFDCLAAFEKNKTIKILEISSSEYLTNFTIDKIIESQDNVLTSIGL